MDLSRNRSRRVTETWVGHPDHHGQNSMADRKAARCGLSRLACFGVRP